MACCQDTPADHVEEVAVVDPCSPSPAHIFNPGYRPAGEGHKLLTDRRPAELSGVFVLANDSL